MKARGMKTMLGVAAYLTVLAGWAMAEVDIQGLLDEAVAGKKAEVVVPPGTYRVKQSGKRPDYHLYVRGAEDVKIIGDGVTLLFDNPRVGGLYLEDCRNVTVKGFTIDWGVLPFTQGRIVEINVAEGWYEIEVEKGYTDDAERFAPGADAFLYDPKTRLLKAEAWDMFGASVKAARPGVLRVQIERKEMVKRNNAAVGDLLLVSMRKKMGMRFYNCGGMNVDGVTIWTAPGIAFQEAAGAGGSHYNHFTVTRGPAPEGGAPRLVSSTADAFHSSGVQHGPVVENCRLEYQGDDGVAIHGSYALVVEGGATGVVRVSPKYENPFRDGDALRIYDGKTWELKETAAAKSVAKAQKPAVEAVDLLWKRYHDEAEKKKYFTLTVDRPVEAAVGDLVSSPGRLGSGFVVRNNVIGHQRARGIIIKADDGVIEGNMLEDIASSGISVGPEFAYWLEGDYANNVVIRDNRIRQVGRGANVLKYDKAVQVGAITISALSPDGKIPGGRGNRHISIEGNKIEECGGVGMLITCAQDVSVKNNQIGVTNCLGKMAGGTKHGVDANAAVFVDHAQAVRFEQNQFSGKGVVVGADVAEISR